MAFDYTNYLETATQANNGDFSFTDRDGNTGDTCKAANTAGEWCEEDGSTTSSGTGPGSNPPSRAGFIYTESSTPAASTTWAMKRTTSFDSTTQAVYLDLIYNLNTDAELDLYIEYATVASPNETTDWTILETIGGGLGDNWISDTFDFSAISSSTLWIRIRLNSPNAYTNDAAFSTWREYSVDSAARDQEGFRWREDDGNESGASWLETQDTDLSRAAGATTRLRVLVDTDGNTPTGQMKIQYKRDDEADSEWRDV